MSTKEGLSKWWLVPPTAIDLRAGGVFHHFWRSAILEVQERALIDFDGMRFELKPAGDETLFAFVDCWHEAASPGAASEQPGGPGTPWPGVAAGWHKTVDALETAVTGRTFDYGEADLTRFYTGYLRDLYGWAAMATAKCDRRRKQGIPAGSPEWSTY